VTALRVPGSRTHRPGPFGLPRLLGAVDDFAAHRRRYGPLPLNAANRAGRRELIDMVGVAGLRGRGGAGFPTARKLAAVSGGRRPMVLVNGCESEPASGKDRTLLATVPHLVLDGAVLAAYAVGAEEIVVCVHRGGDQVEELARALAERRGDPVRWHVTGLPRRYVASEESALVGFLNRGDARPVTTPPRPFEKGVRNRPTLIDNVETLAHLAQIVHYGPDWFRSIGAPTDPGSTLVTVSGAVFDPGVYEIPTGAPLATAIELAGGPSHPLRAALVGGYFGGWVPLPAAYGLPLLHERSGPGVPTVGAGVVVALPSGCCGVAETARVLRYLAEESARQCGPCTFGLPAIARDFAIVAHGRPDPVVDERLVRRLDVIAGRGACRHPDGAVGLARSALEVFADDFEDHLDRGPCAGIRRAPMLPLPPAHSRDRSWQ
jgi:NADH:ubiquinone oxidoreductase subunit F (NADH-binding)